jgi:DNA-binding NarL/FixJ family response regulator
MIQQFSETVARCKPQLVLLNRNLAGHLGFDPSQRWPLPRQDILVLPYSVARDGDELFASTPGGAEGYVFTRVKPALLLEPLSQARNLATLSSSEYQASIRSFFKYLLQPAHGAGPAGLGKLTRREHDVLGLLSKGYIDKEIAESLGISAWTVHDHIKDIFGRLQVRTRSEAVARYLEK